MKSTNLSINTVLILGAGELGLPVLRAMSRQARLHHALNISVLLRPEAARAVTGPHRARRDALARLGIAVVEGDLQQNSVDELSTLLRGFDAVINCSGFVGGAGTQIKITQPFCRRAWRVISRGSSAWTTMLSVQAAGNRCGMNSSKCATCCVRRRRRSG